MSDDPFVRIRFEEIVSAVFDALKDLGNVGTNRDINENAVARLEQAYPNQNITRNESGKVRDQLEYRAGWARTHLKSYGVLENPQRGVWSIVPGKQDIELDPKKVIADFGRRDNRRQDEDGTSDKNLDKWKETLFSVLTETLAPDAFERLTKRLLVGCGFTNVKVTGKTNDGGIDGTATAKINDLLGFSVVFQCKRWKNSSVGIKEIQSFRGAMMSRADRGLFVTTSRFTSDAKKEAGKEGAPPIDLIDGELLMEKLKELNLGITTEQVEKVTINEEWYKEI